MCFTTRFPVSRPLASALDSAFLRRPRRNSADLTGQRARETPHCFPARSSAPSPLILHPAGPASQGIRILASSFTSTVAFNEVSSRSIRTLRGPADAASVASHSDGLLFLDHILKELLGPGKLPAVDRLRSLAGVLEGNAEVGPAGASRLRRGDLSRCVPNLGRRESLVSLGLGGF